MPLILLFLAAAAPNVVRSPAHPPVAVRHGERAPVAPGQSAANRRAFVEGLMRSSGAEVFAAIRRNYPEDFEAFIDRLFDAAISVRGDRTAAIERGAQETLSFMRAKRADLLNAPAADLLIVSARTLAFYRAVSATDVAYCARFTVIGASASGLPRSLTPQMSAITVALIDAAGAGHRAAEPNAGRGTVIPQDAVAWLANMRALDGENEVVPLLSDSAALRQATPAIQCRLGMMMHEAIGGLPPEQGGNIIAYFLGESLRIRPQ